MKKYGKFFVLLLIIVLIAILFSSGLHNFLSLEYMKSQQQEFGNFYINNPFLTIAIYMLIYITTTALSFPGAAILTLLGGALFGLFTGTILVSFSSTIGATLAFLASRLMLRDWVQNKFGKQLKIINDGVEKEGALYLFTLRLIPAVPFFIINLAMGLTPMKPVTFFIVSQIGMLAGTIVYVNAGTQLAQIESLDGILSPSLLFSFVLLGLFPIITKKAMSYFKPKAETIENG